jgi:hypothetical protein
LDGGVREGGWEFIQIAGQANTKFTAPKPREAISAVLALAPASTKMVLE